MTDGFVPAASKLAFITPRLKKPGIDAADVRPFRPVSNLSDISTERLVARRLLEYLVVNNLLLQFQSAYRPHHSVETAAVVKVLADILPAIDIGELAGPWRVTRDLFAAFDTLDHDVLLRRLRIKSKVKYSAR